MLLSGQKSESGEGAIDGPPQLNPTTPLSVVLLSTSINPQLWDM